MPRDSSGNYTLPLSNPVVDGTVIDVNWANPTMSDVAVQLNNVLTRDGLLGPTLPLLVVDGTSALPGLAFNGQPGTGWYLTPTQIGFSYSGATIFTGNANGMTLAAGKTLSIPSAPSAGTDAANKAYVDTAVATGGGAYVPLTGNSTLDGILTAQGFVGPLTGAASSNLLLTGGTLSGNLTAPNFIGNLSGNATSSNSTTGNAGTATALQTSRTINGVPFNGTSAINIGIAWNDITSKPTAVTTLSGTNTGDQVNISGNANTATTATNLAGGSTGSLPYQTTTNGTGQLAPSTNGYILQTNGPGLAPTWVSPAGVGGAAPAGTLTGTTLAANVVASSLTSFGASIALGTPGSGNLANCSFPTLNQNTTGSAASATLATKASTLAQSGGNGVAMTFAYSGQSGQPSWLWGTNDGVTTQVYTPSNFNVNSANTATTASTANTVAVGATAGGNIVLRDSGTVPGAIPVGALITGSRVGTGTAVGLLGTVTFDGANYLNNLAASGATTAIQYGTWRHLGQVNGGYGIWIRVG